MEYWREVRRVHPRYKKRWETKKAKLESKLKEAKKQKRKEFLKRMIDICDRKLSKGGNKKCV